MVRLINRAAALILLSLIAGCSHAPDIYEITTTVDGEPVEATVVAVSSEDPDDVLELETNGQGFVSFKFPHSSVWEIEFLNSKGDPYPATATATPEVNGKIHFVTVELESAETVKLP